MYSIAMFVLIVDRDLFFHFSQNDFQTMTDCVSGTDMLAVVIWFTEFMERWNRTIIKATVASVVESNCQTPRLNWSNRQRKLKRERRDYFETIIIWFKCQIIMNRVTLSQRSKGLIIIWCCLCITVTTNCDKSHDKTQEVPAVHGTNDDKSLDSNSPKNPLLHQQPDKNTSAPNSNTSTPITSNRLSVNPSSTTHVRNL